MAWLKIRMTVIPMSNVGEQDGFRANALIVALPIIATTTDGPMMAALMTMNSVKNAMRFLYSSNSSTKITHLFS